MTSESSQLPATCVEVTSMPIPGNVEAFFDSENERAALAGCHDVTAVHLSGRLALIERTDQPEGERTQRIAELTDLTMHATMPPRGYAVMIHEVTGPDPVLTMDELAHRGVN